MPAKTRELQTILQALEPAVQLEADRVVRSTVSATESGEVAPPVCLDGTPIWLVRPRDYFPETLPTPDQLRVYWRDLVQATAAREGRKHAAQWTAWLNTLGADVLPELRFVLVAGHIVREDVPPDVVLARAIGILADLNAFEPGQVGIVFPALMTVNMTWHDGETRRIQALKPPEAADGPRLPLPLSQEIQPDQTERIRTEAIQNAEQGLYSRAVLKLGALPNSEPDIRKLLANGLVDRLGRTFDWSADERQAWVRALEPVTRYADGIWSAGGRLLKDLERIAARAERRVSVVTATGLFGARGRRRLQRELPAAALANRMRLLQSARRNLNKMTNLPEHDRLALYTHLTSAIHKEDERLREQLGPQVRAALTEAGLVPNGLVETVGLHGITENLFDRLTAKGFLRFGDLRDAVAAGQLKMADLAGPIEWLRGDSLLQADRLLGERLAGVYRPAEIYLRVIHRATAVVFGVPWGRWAWRYALLPAAAAILTVEFAGYVVLELHAVTKWLSEILAARTDAPTILTDATVQASDALNQAAPDGHDAGLAFGPGKLFAAAIIFTLVLLVVNNRRAQEIAWASVNVIRTCLYFVFVAGPKQLWQSRQMRAILRHPLTRTLATPLTVGINLAIILFILGISAPGKWYAVLASIGATTLIIRTGPGRRAELRFWHTIHDIWRAVTTNLIPGLIAAVMDFFRAAGDAIERGLYAVDDFLRMRSGQSFLIGFVKTVFAVIWAPIAYLVRFAFILLIEPQINPVKHFPVVTVSHKLLLPLIGVLADATGISLKAAGLVIAAIPGVFGFIVWELRGNWQLYRANRPSSLKPVALGHHGETMRRYLRPGFHSGTIPAIYRKLFTLWRRARVTNRVLVPTKQLHARNEVAETVHHFLHRELVALLTATPDWKGRGLSVGSVQVNVISIRATLTITNQTAPIRLLFQLVNDEVELSVTLPDWVNTLPPDAQETLRIGLGGLRAMTALSELVQWQEWSAFWDRARQPA